MHHLLRYLPRSVMVVIALAVLVTALLAVGTSLRGEYLWSATWVVATFQLSYLLVPQVRGRRQRSGTIQLRNQARHIFKQRLAGAKEIRLKVEAEHKTVLIRRSFFGGVSYMVMVAELDEDTEFDWNLAFAQQKGLARLQIFHFPPVLGYAEHEIHLATGPEDVPEDKRSRLSTGYNRDRMRQLELDAAYATEPELQALLYLVNAGVPVETPRDNPE